MVGAGAAVGAGAGAGPATADCAIADELMVVESSMVIAGGTTTANLPAVARKARRSGSASRDRFSCGSIQFSPFEGVYADDLPRPRQAGVVTVELCHGSAALRLKWSVG